MSAAQILVVEDESIVAKGIEAELKSLGYGVSGIASSGEEALRKAAQTCPDLVLMDIVLKGKLDGVRTTEELREWFDIPVIYLTAYADDQTLKRAKVTEPYGYLIKPYEEKELRTTIEIALYKHRIEATAKEMQRWRSAVLRSIGEAVVVTDARGRIRLTNPLAEKLTGWPDADAFGKDLGTVIRLLDGRTRTALGLPSSEALSGGRVVSLEGHTLLIAKDGREVPVAATVAAIENGQGGFCGCVVALRDVTDSRLAAESLQQGVEQVRWLQKMESLGCLAGGMADDFNEILTTICDDLAMALPLVPETGPAHKHLANAEQVARQGRESLKPLLASARLAVPRAEPVNLNELIGPVVERLGREADSRVAIEFKPAVNLWAVQADPAQLREAILNLCLATRDALPEGGKLLLETENVTLGDHPGIGPKPRRGDFVCLRVRNAGPGTQPTRKGQTDEPGCTAKEPGKGAGLGPALVFGVVKQHRGWMHCRAGGDGETHLEVFLPRGDAS
jgi:PAS domain S-box-containing protein